MIKNFIKSMMSETQRQSLRRKANVFRASTQYHKDKVRFLKGSSAVRSPVTQGQLAAHLTMDYHRLEKGMALPTPRVGFGKDVIERLLININLYTSRFGQDDLTQIVHGVLKQYQARQAALGHTNPSLDTALTCLDEILSVPNTACGVTALPLEGLFPVETEAANLFLMSRHSVRQYTGELVPNNIIAHISELAQRAPSVCNRQCGRLYSANTRKKITEALSYQNGNRGFGDTIGGLFIVTADLRAFVSLGERNQGYVDGGIFAQQTLLAIHAQHLGGCMLNWSMTHDKDRRLREAFSIPDYEIIITMIGFGHCVEAPEIAVSPRIPVAEVLRTL